MGYLRNIICLGILLAPSIKGAPFDGSHRSAPVNPQLYYRNSGSEASFDQTVYSGSHRSAPLNHESTLEAYRQRLGNHFNLFNPDGSHRSAPVSAYTGFDAAQRYVPTNNIHTGPRDAQVWQQVWER